MQNDALRALDDAVDAFPERASGEDLYVHISDLASRLERSDRRQLVEAFVDWLKRRREPQTMLAVDIIGQLRLVELRGHLEELLSDVQAGRAFLPFYANPISRALAMV
jgi:hypothetical protein